MKERVGLWIDHRKAVIAAVSGKNGKVSVIESNVDKQPGRYNGVRTNERYDRLQVSVDDSLDRGYMNRINKYYDNVIAAVKGAESIVIFGPGEAKIELKKRLEKNNLSRLVVAVEAADKMTDHQIEAKVRKYYNANIPPSRKSATEEVPEVVLKKTPEERPTISERKSDKATVAKPTMLTASPVKEKVKTGPSHEEIARQAYFIYLSEGCPQGRSQEHWKKAEAMLKSV